MPPSRAPPTYANLRQKGIDGLVFFRVYTPSTPDPSPSRNFDPDQAPFSHDQFIMPDRLPSQPPRLDDVHVLGRSIVRHLILVNAERASLRLFAEEGRRDLMRDDEDSQDGGEENRQDEADDGGCGWRRGRDVDPDAMDIDLPLHPTPPASPQTTSRKGAVSRRSREGGIKAHPADTESHAVSKRRDAPFPSCLHFRAAEHAGRAFSQLDMAPAPCTLADSPWRMMTDCLDSALHTLARGLALDRQYSEYNNFHASNRPAHARRRSAVMAEGRRKWYLAVHVRATLQDCMSTKTDVPLIVNAADVLRTWEEAIEYGTKRQTIRSYRRAADVGKLYLCWTGGRHGERGVMRHDVVSGRAVEGLKTISEWRCTDYHLPFDLPPSWTYQDGYSTREGDSWLDNLVFDPLEDDFGEAMERVRGVTGDKWQHDGMQVEHRGRQSGSSTAQGRVKSTSSGRSVMGSGGWSWTKCPW